MTITHTTRPSRDPKHARKYRHNARKFRASGLHLATADQHLSAHAGHRDSAHVDGPLYSQKRRLIRVTRPVRDHGGKDVEEADGKIEDSHWLDFDPTKPVRLVS